MLSRKQFRFSKGKVLQSILPFVQLFAPLLILSLLVSILCYGASAQELPKKIRGYKVHNIKSTKVSAAKSGDANIPVPEIDLDNLEIADYSLSGITFKAPVRFAAVNISGTIDFISFHDFTVNGVPVDIEEYKDKFNFESGQPIVLPNPVNIFVRTDRAMTVAWKESRDSLPQWKVTGRAFVFGKFRKYGFSFKRVIPVDVVLIVKNPLFRPDKTAH